MKGNQITLEDVEDIRSELNDLESSYKAAFESTNNYKKQLDSELKDSTKIKWELDHQTKRNNDYQKNIDKITLNIAQLKYRLPKIGTSPWSFPERFSFIQGGSSQSFVLVSYRHRAGVSTLSTWLGLVQLHVLLLPFWNFGV